MRKKMSYDKAAAIYRKAKINERLCQALAEVWTESESTQSAPISEDWEKTVTIWGIYGLNRQDFQSFIDAIEANGEIRDEDKWRYFCACAWNAVRVIKDIATDEEVAEGVVR